MRISDWSSDVCSSDLATGKDHRRQIGFQNEAAPQLLHDDHRLDAAPAEAAVVLGERHPQQAEFRHVAPGVAAPAFGLAHRVEAHLESVAVRYETRHALAQQALLVAIVEIPLYPPPPSPRSAE